ncbi:FAD-dependent oxidoreductase [Thermocatellispora tengchongensis]
MAVVGAGPAGLFTADELVRQDRLPVTVDLLERLPVPFGLVRYGVAPDHPKIKAVTRSLQKIVEHPRVRFLGGVGFGAELDREDLLRHYDAVVYAAGAPADRGLGIPGESSPGCHPATAFVSWYSGHPDAGPPFALDARHAVVVGAGNVALDVARVLAKPARALERTDMPQPVLDALAVSKVTDITVLVRRGPEHTRFTTKELRELDELDGVAIRVPPGEAEPGGGPLDRTAENNLALFRSWTGEPAAGTERTITFRFWRRPVEVRGTPSVRELIVERTRLDASGALTGTGEREVLPAGLVLRSVGYRGLPLPGVPFDHERGVIRNAGGRVVDEAGEPCPREYVAGWLKRGPSGVIGTNRMDAAETVALMVEDLIGDRNGSGGPPIDALLRERGISPVTLDGWRRIDAAEIELGRRAGRERTKITDWAELRRLGGVPG